MSKETKKIKRLLKEMEAETEEARAKLRSADFIIQLRGQEIEKLRNILLDYGFSTVQEPLMGSYTGDIQYEDRWVPPTNLPKVRNIEPSPVSFENVQYWIDYLESLNKR